MNNRNMNISEKLTAKTILLTSTALTMLFLTGCGAETSSAAAVDESTAITEQLPDAVTANVGAADTPAAVSSFTVSSIGNNQNTITVNSSEKVAMIPDIAEVVYAVHTEAKDAARCQQKNTENINQVVALLKNLGVAETSIQTSNYYMYPIYNYSGNTQRITGYEATTSLTVSDLPIDNLENILTESVNAGINNIQSITYQSSKYDEGYTEALTLAVETAKIKATALAKASGCSIGGVANIYENSNYSQARYTDNALASKMRSYKADKEEGMADFTNIMPGEVDIEVNITVEYFIQ